MYFRRRKTCNLYSRIVVYFTGSYTYLVTWPACHRLDRQSLQDATASLWVRQENKITKVKMYIWEYKY